MNGKETVKLRLKKKKTLINFEPEGEERSIVWEIEEELIPFSEGERLWWPNGPFKIKERYWSLRSGVLTLVCNVKRA